MKPAPADCPVAVTLSRSPPESGKVSLRRLQSKALVLQADTSCTVCMVGGLCEEAKRADAAVHGGPDKAIAAVLLGSRDGVVGTAQDHFFPLTHLPP